MPWRPQTENEIPTLGFIMLDWYSDMLAAPSVMDYAPFLPYREQEDFILNWYALDENGKRLYNRAVLGRPRGWGKSPLLAAIAIGEALGPCRFAGWDADGQPVGMPWREIRKPQVSVAAVSDDQTRNTWVPLQDMLRNDAPIHHEYNIEPYDSYVDLGGLGRIDKLTSSARSIKGRPDVFAVLDQTEEWVQSNGGLQLAETIRSNVGKMGGSSVESPNAYMPGDESVSERSHNFAKQIKDGTAKDTGLLYDHREAPGNIDIDDKDSLLEGLRIAYGDSSNHPDGCVLHDPPCAPGHHDCENDIHLIWAPDFDTQKARSDYLNQVVAHADAWLTSLEVEAAVDKDGKLVTILEGDTITLGFDGSRGRVRGRADATALIGCRVRDGALFEIKVWEPHPNDKDWIAPTFEVDLYLEMTMERYNVVGFYADPSGWNESVARWEAKFGKRLKVKATQQRPIAAWPRGKDTRVAEYLKQLRQAICNLEIRIAGDAPNLVRHMKYARYRKYPRLGWMITKSYPESPDKIDGAYAATMAFKARTDALAMGVAEKKAPARKMSGKAVVS